MNHQWLSLVAVSLTLATSQHCLLQQVGTKRHADGGAIHEEAAGNHELDAASSVGMATGVIKDSMLMRSGAETPELASKIQTVCSMTSDFWQFILLAMALSLWQRFRRASKRTNESQDCSPGSTAVQLGPGTETIRKPSNSSKFHGLSGFRLAIALVVICEHFGLLCPEIGGSVFVVLSGCVISVSRRASPGKLKASACSPSDVMVFWIQRLARIMPLYWFAILVVQPWASAWTRTPISVADLLISLPGRILTNWKDMLLLNPMEESHLWFVRTITILYISYPLIELGVFGKSGTAGQSWLWGCASLCICYHIAVTFWASQPQSQTWLSGNYWEVYTSPVLRMPGFLLGMLVPHLEVAPVLNYLPYLADALLPILLYSGHTYSRELLPLLQVSGGVPFFAFIIWSLCFGECESLLGRLLKQPVAFTAGELSYGVYIYHLYFIVMIGCYKKWSIDDTSSRFDSGDASSVALLLYKVTVLMTVLMASLILSQTMKILIEDPAIECAKYFKQMCCHVPE